MFHIDILDEILKRLDFKTLMICLRLNSDIRKFIMNRRKCYARGQVEIFTLEKDVYSDDNKWKIEIYGFNRNQSILDFPEKKLKSILFHLKPSLFQYKYPKDVEIDDNFGVSEIPTEWFQEIKMVSFAMKNQIVVEKCYEVLKMFPNIKEIEIEGYTATEHFSEMLGWMPAISSIRMYFREPDEKRIIASNDSDLEIVVAKSRKLSALIIGDIENNYTVDGFVQFLTMAHFSSRVDIALKNYPSPASTFCNWLYENTIMRLATYIPKPRSEAITLPHRFEYIYRGSSFRVTFSNDFVA